MYFSVYEVLLMLLIHNPISPVGNSINMNIQLDGQTALIYVF